LTVETVVESVMDVE